MNVGCAVGILMDVVVVIAVVTVLLVSGVNTRKSSGLSKIAFMTLALSIRPSLSTVSNDVQSPTR